MTIDIKHKHASHVIIIEGQAFKANDRGQWDLTDIWRALKDIREDLEKRQPKRWSQTKEAVRFFGGGKSGSQRVGREEHTFATKQATLRYAAYVSSEFEDMVYDAFEAILEMPEVALLVADKMRSLGNDHSAAILERTTENQDRNSILREFNRSRKPRTLSPGEKAMRAAMGVAKRHEKANPMR
ncbi:hypothetical protein [Pseudomonas syringae]|uniref:hypothetical protein n=1 Tax=Pseudomonas syringae TaxID=317 RepID=UPI001F0DF18A|nr:hypothetical protein [Pseudomonas syringae]MCH5668851.1 hypothetical protein [Pseudomonas syringae pv. syringae]